jgi:hypothetical protein
MCMFCRSLCILLCFFIWPLCCLFFFDIRILNNPLVSSSSSSVCRIHNYVLHSFIAWFITVLFIMSSTIGASNGTGNANHSAVTEFILGFHVAQSFVLCFVVNHWSFLFYFFFPLYCLSIVLQLLINRLICSNLS